MNDRIVRARERAAWHEDRAEKALETLQAHRFGRPVFGAFGGGERPDEREEGLVEDVVLFRRLAELERAAADRLEEAARARPTTSN